MAFVGFLDSVYLTIAHYKDLTVPCTLAHGCEIVLTSKYATFLGVPIALFGAGFYVVCLALLLLYFQSNKNILPTILLGLTTIALGIGIYLVYLQAAVLHAFCQYCLLSELIDFLLFDCAWWLWRRTNS
ncbi:MAG TPA: vitamin K epoxide reductase family protein [Patescibacteria group bacterium]|nr:vitamin K epoxide reductase family protein [Patescibacteria group bacterium]